MGLTVSIGVTDLRPGDRVEELMARADAALYSAKHEGRDRTVLDMQPMPAGQLAAGGAAAT